MLLIATKVYVQLLLRKKQPKTEDVGQHTRQLGFFLFLHSISRRRRRRRRRRRDTCAISLLPGQLILSSMLQGVDLIAAAAPRILKRHPDVQLVVVGPVGDLVGARAYHTLKKLAKTFPGRVYASERVISGAEKCVLLAAADYCWLPSRFEPCSLVDLEFGWNGAIIVGHQTGLCVWEGGG